MLTNLYTIERSWSPGPIVRFLESNPITKIFWNVIKFCIGYGDDYRCTDWDNMKISVDQHFQQIKPGHPDYARCYKAVQNFLYYNPHLRTRYPMTAPVSHNRIQRGVPPMDRPHTTSHTDKRVVVTFQQNQQVLPLSAQHQQVLPLSAQNHVPPMDSRRVGLPLSAQNHVPPMDSRRVGLPLSAQNHVPPMDSRRVGLPLSAQNHVPPMDEQQR
jgi:hypothetical protein